MEADDPELLRRYAATRDENAFGELVRRYLNLVYFAARRQIGGDAHRAEDVAQAVFTLLARKAASLTRHQTLAGWLHTTTRFCASEARRAERRRVARESEAHTMQTLSTDSAAPADWERLRPIIDEALNELGDADREAVLLWFFADQPLAAIGAKLHVSENAARMRVERALDKLHALLAKRGVTSTAAALAVVLANQAAAMAPAGLAASVTSAALAGSAAAAGGGAVAAMKCLGFMSTSKIMMGVAGAIAVAATAITWQQQQANAGLRREMAALRQQQTGAVASLRADNERLSAEKKSAEEAASAEHIELVQLREAREAFRQRQAAAARNAAAAPGARGGNAPAEPGALSPGMVSMELMQNVGRATPTATAQSIAWGLQHADTKTVASLLAFDPPEREKLEAFIATLPETSRAEYGTPEQVVALLMAGSPRPIAGVQLLSSTQPDPATEVQIVQWQYQTGEVQQNELKFHRDADGWKQVVSAPTVDRVIAYFKGKQ